MTKKVEWIFSLVYLDARQKDCTSSHEKLEATEEFF